jgi:hypothetical protein
MQRNSGAVSEAELFQVIAAEERVFSENFIQHQLNILKAASQTLTQASLLEERKITAIMNYMRDLYANTEYGDIFGKSEKGRNYHGLLSIIDKAVNKFTQHYQWSGTHPLLPAIKKIRKNIIDYVHINQPQFSASPEQKSEAVDGDVFDVMPIHPFVGKEKIFSDNFIKKQMQLIEKDRVKALLDYMQDLAADTEHFAIAGNKSNARSYDGLQTLLDEFSAELKNNYRWAKMHPLLPALTQIKKNIQAAICIAQPQFSEHLHLNQGQNQSSIARARFEIVKDTCGILACLAWAIPEKVITLDNGCETICGPEEACCPEVSLPREDIYCNLWAPKNSIKAFSKDIPAQNETINNFQSAPIRHTMS